MQIVVHDGHEVIRNLSFEDSAIAIGSHTDCPVYLPDMRVAMQQAVIVPIPGGSWMLDPVDLTHKTILNGRQITGRTDLEHGDEILISDFLIKIFFEYQPDAQITKSATGEEVAKIRQYPLPPGALIRKPNEPLTVPDGAEQQLARFARALHDCTDIAKLMDLTLRTLREVFDARLVWMGARRQDYGRLEFVEGRTVDGTTKAEPPDLEGYAYRCLERTQFIVVPRTSDETAQAAMAVPLVAARGRLGVLFVDSKPDGIVYDFGHLDLLCMYASMVATQWEALVEDQIHWQEAVTAGELSFVREVQSRLDPTNVPQWDELQFAVYCKPGLDRSGDVYDVMRMPNGLATFFVGHVDASATRTALALVEMRTTFRIAAMHADPPHILLREFNWLLSSEEAGCTAGAAAIVTNPRTGAAEYALAGNIGAIVVDDCGEARDLGDPTVPVLGTTRNYAYVSHPLRIMPDETVVLFTPGCLTVAKADGEPLGRTRLAEALCDGFGSAASDAVNNLLGDLSAFFKDGRQSDDITLVFVHRTRG
jgi:serine phosphatase RsbU (regulator of sigma subunit)